MTSHPSISLHQLAPHFSNAPNASAVSSSRTGRLVCSVPGRSGGQQSARRAGHVRTTSRASGQNGSSYFCSVTDMSLGGMGGSRRGQTDWAAFEGVKLKNRSLSRPSSSSPKLGWWRKSAPSSTSASSPDVADRGVRPTIQTLATCPVSSGQGAERGKGTHRLLTPICRSVGAQLWAM